jgi:hypothetical protein
MGQIVIPRSRSSFDGSSDDGGPSTPGPGASHEPTVHRRTSSSFIGVSGKTRRNSLATASPKEIKSRLGEKNLSFYNRDPTHEEFEEVRFV